MFIGKYTAQTDKLDLTSARIPRNPLTEHVVKILFVLGLILFAVGCQRFHVKAMKAGAGTFLTGIALTAGTALFYLYRKPQKVIHFSKPQPEPGPPPTPTVLLQNGERRMEAGGRIFCFDSIPMRPTSHHVILSNTGHDRDYAVERGSLLVCPKPVAPSHLGTEHVKGLEAWEELKLGNITITAIPTGKPNTLGWVIFEDDTYTYTPGDDTTWSNPALFQEFKEHFSSLDRIVLPTNLKDPTVMQAASQMISLISPTEIIIPTEGGDLEECDSCHYGPMEIIILPTGMPGTFAYATKLNGKVSYLPGKHTVWEGEHISKITQRLGEIDEIHGVDIKVARTAGLNIKELVETENEEPSLDGAEWPQLDTLAAKAAFLMFQGLSEKLRINFAEDFFHDAVEEAP